MAPEEAEKTARRAECVEQLLGVQEPVIEARRRLAAAEADLIPRRDELFLRLYELGMGATAIGNLIGVKRQTVYQGMNRARLARAQRVAADAPTTKQP